MTENFLRFRLLLIRWLEQSSLFPDKRLHVDLILNPEAGAFKHPRLLRRLLTNLAAAPLRPPFDRAAHREVKVVPWTTDYPGHEKAILAHLTNADPAGPEEQRLVVIAGGDGTSRGALISALSLPPAVRESLVFFRLPLGTGNDAAESRDWAQVLAMLSGRGPFIVEPQPLRVLEVRATGTEIHYSFNIASVGLDAFVVHLTNRFKRWFPGNSYSLMVDAAAFFYELFVRVVPSTVELTERGRTVVLWEAPFLLAALGASGHRTYGAGKKVLPDADNFCLAGKKNLFTKLAYRQPFYQGTHRGLPGITLARGDELRIVSPVRIPLQMDGEVLWLDPKHFPLKMTVVDRGLRVLALAGSAALF